MGPERSSQQDGVLLRKSRTHGGHAMGLGTILLIVLVLVLLGVIPAWPHSRGWGYGPSGLVGVILLVLLILVLTGRL